MLLDLILVKHFRMRRDRKRSSAAALAIYMPFMYKVYRRLTRPWLMNRDLGLTRTRVQEMRTGDKEIVCFAGLAKDRGCLSDPTSFINASKPVKVCHIFHADIVKRCQMYSANVSIYTSKFI